MDTTPSEIFTGAYHARRGVAALVTSTKPRAFVSGPAGSGKTTLLRQIHHSLGSRKLPLRMLDGKTEIHRIPPSEVLFVDDVHLLEPDELDAVRSRSANPDAALIVSAKPWPRSPGLTEISNRLQQGTPPFVLGQVQRSDLTAYLKERGSQASHECIDRTLAMTGGVAWLVTHALVAHRDLTCSSDAHYLEIQSILEELIAHRVDSLTEQLRRLVERSAVVGAGRALRSIGDAASDDLVTQGYAEGLLLRTGEVTPIVRAAVRRTIPAHRIVELVDSMSDEIALTIAEGDTGILARTGLNDSRIASALVGIGDRAMKHHPRQTAELYRLAIASGFDAAELLPRRVQAAWASGDLDSAADLVDQAIGQESALHPDQAADTLAAVWASRCMMGIASDIYEAQSPQSTESRGKAQVAHVGAGLNDRPAAPASKKGGGTGSTTKASKSVPSTLGTSMQLLESGLRSSLEKNPSASALSDLVRASTLYNASRTDMPVPELPAVIASIVAVGSGDLATAQLVINTAVGGQQGGAWARRRLLLWRAWVSLQNGRPADARQMLTTAEQVSSPISPRDEFLLHSARVTLARRYGDMPELEASWNAAVDSVRHVDMDLYMLLPLSSMIGSATRLGDDTTLAEHFSRGLQILQSLGSPPLWTSHLRWAGIQKGIILNRPDSLAPHARALVALAPRNLVAETMAQAGKVWVSVLGGTVDEDAVEDAARALADVGIAWDGARLAAQSARRADDRRVSARLLSCARQLHPREEVQVATPNEQTQPTSSTAASEDSQLSERELDVARLVLQGKTYVEIGETIYISPRTVEHHVANIRRRLGASSRSDLISKLRLMIESPSEGTQPHTTIGVPDATP